jgi:hypothetical protein
MNARIVSICFGSRGRGRARRRFVILTRSIRCCYRAALVVSHWEVRQQFLASLCGPFRAKHIVFALKTQGVALG